MHVDIVNKRRREKYAALMEDKKNRIREAHWVRRAEKRTAATSSAHDLHSMLDLFLSICFSSRILTLGS